MGREAEPGERKRTRDKNGKNYCGRHKDSRGKRGENEPLRENTKGPSHNREKDKQSILVLAKLGEGD